MKVIVTGSSGFVGTNLLKNFKEDKMFEVSSLNFRKNLPSSIFGDAIIHLAGKAHDLKNASNPDEYFSVNYKKTKELFDLFINSDLKDFIYFSSVKAVSDSVEGVLTEDMVPNPTTPYGQSKLKAESYLLSKKLPEDKRVFILRPCMIHGPGNKGNLNLLYRVVKKGLPYPLGAFENKRSFLSISNLLFVINNILKDKDILGGVYNVADDVPLSTRELIKIIADNSNYRGSIINFSRGLIYNVAKIGDILKLPLNTERLKKLTENYVVSNKKIKDAIGIHSLPISSKEGLAETILSFEE